MWFQQGKRHRAVCFQWNPPEMVSSQADWGKKTKQNFNWILSEVLSLLFIVYSAKWWKKLFSLQMWEREGKKQRFCSNEYLAGVLPESWLVCSSINSSVLSLRLFARRRCCCSVRLGTTSWRGQLIGSSWLDPRSFSTSELWPNLTEWPLEVCI